MFIYICSYIYIYIYVQYIEDQYSTGQTHISEKDFQCFNMNLLALLKLTVLVIVPFKRCLVFNEM